MTVVAFDRTTEFRSCAQLLYDRVVSGRIKLKPPHSKPNTQNYLLTHNLVAEFLEKCNGISEEIKITRLKLKKLNLLLQNELSKSVSENCRKLMDILKVDIVDLNKVKMELRTYISRLKNECIMNKQQLSHFHGIITGIEYILSQFVFEFRSILEDYKQFFLDQPNSTVDSNYTPSLCTQSQHQVTDNKNEPFVVEFDKVITSNQPHQFNSGGASQHKANIQQGSTTSLFLPTFSSVNNLNKIQCGNALFNTDLTVSSNTSFVNMTGQSSSPYEQNQSFQQLQTFAQPVQTNFIDQEIRQRDAAMRRVESTIVQLGEIYQQFSTLVQEQSETVLRIDANTDNLELNVSEAHGQLINYFNYISKQRSLMFKAFGVCLICFVIFAWIRR